MRYTEAMATDETGERKHAYSVEAAVRLPEPSYAERVRTLLSEVKTGTLSTVSRKHEGYPFGSLMPYALDGKGRPLFLVSTMAMHTQNLKADARASLFVAQAVSRSSSESDPLAAARATLIGRAEPVPASEVAVVREIYLAAHKTSQYWVDFADFKFFRLDVADVYYVGGFGMMGWVDAAEYTAAEPDPLAKAAAGIMTHVNEDHVAAMILLARTHSGIEAIEATMTAVDRLGFSMRLKTEEGMKGTRINFIREVRSAEESRKVLVEMVREAR